MRQGIGLQGYGGRDPLVEFKREAFDMFDQLLEQIQQQTARRIFHVTLNQAPASVPPANTRESGPGDTPGDGNGTGAAAPAAPRSRTRARAAAAAAAATASGNGDAATDNVAATAPSGKVGRNDPCPCGSGRKFKKCHGAGVGV
jgi:preprotein translocase subunit SecA